MKKKITHYVKRLIEIISRSEMRILPGHLAFFLVLSIIPTITLIGYVTSLFSLSIDGVADMIGSNIPDSIKNILITAFNNPGFDTWITILFGFFIASNGEHSIIVASNLLFKIDNQDYLRRRIKAFNMLVIIVLLLVFTLIFIAFGNMIVKVLIDYILIDEGVKIAYSALLFFRWPIAATVIFILIKTIYTIAPDSNIPSKDMTRGALFTTIGWLFVTAIYSIYVTNFANYDMFYGSLSNIIALMTWVYILSYILVIGIAINSESYNRKKKV